MFRILFGDIIKKIQYLCRKHGRIMSQDEMQEKEEFYAKIYLAFTLAALGGVCYLGTRHSDESTNFRLNSIQESSKKSDVRVITIKGFSVVEDYTVKKQNDENTIVTNQNVPEDFSEKN